MTGKWLKPKINTQKTPVELLTVKQAATEYAQLQTEKSPITTNATTQQDATGR